MKKKITIIPVFLPWMGCCNRCIYCNEHAVTGYDLLNYQDHDIFEQLDDYVKEHLTHINGKRTIQIAFFGGSFSNAAIPLQERFLKWASRYIKKGAVDSIRISTRPDGINEEEIRLLKHYHCKSVELGVQSFNDVVLAKNNRGHDSLVAIKAVKALLSAGIETGVHLMTGLYGSFKEADDASFKMGLSLNPHSMRVHPTLVLKNTVLEKLYLNGKYKPLDLREAVETLGKYILWSRSTQVKLNRLGLFIPHDLTTSVIAGPYHPAIGDMARQMANVLEVKALLKENDQVIVDKRTYDGFKTHKGFFEPYLKNEMETDKIVSFSGGE